MSKLFDAMKEVSNFTYTENSALTHKSSLSANVDFFARGSALRDRPLNQKIELFEKAYSENPILALKNLFYSRDVRGGQGERQTFRDIMTEFYSIGVTNKDSCKYKIRESLLFLFSKYGRWDDLIYVINQPSVKEAYKNYAYCMVIMPQFRIDLDRAQKGEKISLLGKWLPSINASSKETRRMARATMYYLDMSPAEYRKNLSFLRKHLDVVERKIHSNNYSEIDYESVPSKASIQYRKAFLRKDTARFTDYMSKVASGNSKMNTSTLYPYDILKKVLGLFGNVLYAGAYTHSNLTEEKLAELQHLENAWNNLPNYLEDKTENVLVVADTSGSMYPDAITVSVSLALYTAERNKGLFHNQFLTFSGNPELVQFSDDDDFLSKINKTTNSSWGMNTDLQKTFDLILNSAVKNKISIEEMPSTLVIISDMEFDSATDLYEEDKTNFETIQRKYKQFGYKMPKLVFWNVNARNNQSPVTKDERGVVLASGRSPVVLKHVLNAEEINPEEFMLQVLNSERYRDIEFAFSRRES